MGRYKQTANADDNDAPANIGGCSSHWLKSTLFRVASLGYLLAIVVASLLPFRGWRSEGVSIKFLMEASTIWMWHDVVANFLAYIPLGIVFYFTFRGKPSIKRSAPLIALPAFCLSLCMEAAQIFLDGRTPSALDIFFNYSGALLGVAACLRVARLYAFEPEACVAADQSQPLSTFVC